MTPVVMTVIATVLAGLSSSEMTKAQYHRSVAGQNIGPASVRKRSALARTTRAAWLAPPSAFRGRAPQK